MNLVAKATPEFYFKENDEYLPPLLEVGFGTSYVKVGGKTEIQAMVRGNVGSDVICGCLCQKKIDESYEDIRDYDSQSNADQFLSDIKQYIVRRKALKAHLEDKWSQITGVNSVGNSNYRQHPNGIYIGPKCRTKGCEGDASIVADLRFVIKDGEESGLQSRDDTWNYSWTSPRYQDLTIEVESDTAPSMHEAAEAYGEIEKLLSAFSILVQGKDIFAKDKQEVKDVTNMVIGEPAGDSEQAIEVLPEANPVPQGTIQ
jgi:hypothetical protein